MISAFPSRLGMYMPDWFFDFPFLLTLYVGDGLFVDLRNDMRQSANTATSEFITMGLLLRIDIYLE